LPSVDFNISDPATAFTETNRLRLVRARKIAPVLLGEWRIPMAPIKNTLYGLSYHRIRDTDLYFAGFRRGVMAADGAEPQRGTLFIFVDLYHEASPFF